MEGISIKQFINAQGQICYSVMIGEKLDSTFRMTSEANARATVLARELLTPEGRTAAEKRRAREEFAAAWGVGDRARVDEAVRRYSILAQSDYCVSIQELAAQSGIK